MPVEFTTNEGKRTYMLSLREAGEALGWSRRRVQERAVEDAALCDMRALRLGNLKWAVHEDWVSARLAELMAPTPSGMSGV